MIDAKVLLADLTRLLKRLEDDLRERALSPASEVPELRSQLQAEWKAVGTIPMREREKLYTKFHKAIDAVFERYRRRAEERYQRLDAVLAALQYAENPETAPSTPQEGTAS